MSDRHVTKSRNSYVELLELRQQSQGLYKTKPEPSTSASAPNTLVVRRKGLFSSIPTLIAEVEDPKTYSTNVKWLITGAVSFTAWIAPMGGAIFYPALAEVEEDLHASAAVTNLSLALYLLSLGVFPLWWSNFGQVFGRRPIYIISFSIAIVFSVPAALAQSITVLLVMRMLSGGALASVQVLGAGTVADIWEPQHRGHAMAIFFMGPQLGPLVAPIIGGALANRWGWRSTMWFMLAFPAFVLVLHLFVVPETSVQSKKLPGGSDEKSSSKEGWLLNTFKMLFIDPFKAFLVLRYAAILLVVYSTSLTAVYLYVLNISMEAIFRRHPYNFSPFIVGLLYVPLSVGYLVGSLFGGRWHDYVMQRAARKAGRYDEVGKPILYPEDRMQENAWCAFLLAPAGLVWYGWSTDKTAFWLIPMIANFFTGIGISLIIGITMTMLTEFIPRDNRGTASTVFFRFGLGCVGTGIADPMVKSLGCGWTFTLWALVALASSGAIILLKIYGPKWRKDMEAHLKATARA